jgi:hypothetical protein
MADKEPMAEPFRADDATVTPWAEVCAHLERAPDTYWLATVRPNGRPHVMPLLAVLGRWQVALLRERYHSQSKESRAELVLRHHRRK